MSTFVATLALDGSADPTRMDLINLVIGDQEQRTLRIDGFETTDSGISVTLIAKTDFVDDDDDPDTLQVVATLTTPTRDPGSRLATFVISSDDTRELALGRIHRVIATLTRSAVQYTKTVATGFIAAVTPGATATAPSDEATLRAAGDASVLSAITDKIDSVTGTADRITIGGTATAPTVDIASTYAGQTSINTLGTVTTGVWNGTSIDTAHTAAKVVAVAGVSGRTSIGGTASNPTIDVDAAYPGQASIVTLGAVSTGTWNATTIAANKGGTGLTGFGAVGAMLYAAAITTLAVLSGNTTTAKKFLNQTGDGTNSAAPAWAQIVSADVSDAASANTASKVVVRDASGNFAAGTITATSFSGTHNGAVVGNVTGNTTGTHTGDVVGNSSTATTFQTARTINGVSFNGSANITVTADASTLTGASLNAGVSVLPAQITGLLSGGLINPALLPALAISETFTVSSQAAMLALTAQKGDVAVRSDTSTTFILSGTDPTQLSNWTLLATPVSSVLSVAGKTGVVTLVSADISDATSTNTASRLVLRDSSGNFAAGLIAANISGNAATATQLANTHTIWGQSFNGTADIAGPITTTDANTAGSFTTSAAGSRVVRLISSSASNGASLTLENSSATAAFRNFGIATNFNTSASLEIIVSTVNAGNPLASGTTIAKFEAAQLTLPAGDLIVGSGAGIRKVVINGAAAGAQYIEHQSNGTAIWQVGRGISTGTDVFQIRNAQTAGLPLTIDFTTSLVTLSSGLTVASGTTAVQALTATAGTFSGGLTVSGGSFASGGQVFTTAANGLFVAGKTGSATDLVLTNGAGGTVIDVPTGLTVARFAAATTAAASIRLPHGTAPTSPVNGDIWTTTAGVFVRINGATVGPLT